MAARKGGLGKGLDSLIPASKSEASKRSAGSEDKTKTSKVSQTIAEAPIINSEMKVKIGKVEPNRLQPRKNFDEAALQELADSIKQHGVIQPLLVVDRDGHYEIVAGERRWRAARMAGLKEVPVIVREYTEEENAQIALIENQLREDLNPIEEAIAYNRLIEDYNLTHEEIAEKLSKSRSAITNSMRLLKLSDKVKEMVIAGWISGGHARALLGISDEVIQTETADKVVSERLSVRQTEELVKSILNPAKPKVKTEKKEDKQQTLFYEELEKKLTEKAGARVSIKRKANGKGKIEIDYSSLDELERLSDILSK